MNIGKILMITGAVIIIVGLIIWFFGKMGFPMGELPGDFKYKGDNYSISFPLATSIIASIILTLLINGFLYFFRK